MRMLFFLGMTAVVAAGLWSPACAGPVYVDGECAETLDWDRLMLRFEKHWQLLLSYLVLFSFIYPSDRHRIPKRVMDELTSRLQAQSDAPPSDDRVCRGTLTSRAQYLLDIGRYGYQDARLIPLGNMTPEDAVYWTWAIEHIH